MTDTPHERTVKGRYRRPPAAWLWAALLLIPLLLALLSLLLRGGDDTAGQAAPAPSTTTQVTTQAAAAGNPVQVDGAADAITVTATVPDEATKTALLDKVRGNAGDRQVNDQITVDAGNQLTDVEGLGGLIASAAGQYDPFSIRLDDTSVAITGEAADSATLTPEQLEQQAKEAFPARQVTTQLGAAAAATPSATLACNQIESQIGERLSANPVLFDLESATIDEASRTRLTEIGEALAACNSTGIHVIGRTDASGPISINGPLADARAEAVAAVLIEAGVSADQVTSEGIPSEEIPSAPSDSATGNQDNRRVEITVENEGQ